MSEVTVPMKLTAKQAGALYVKTMRLEDEVKALKTQNAELMAHVKVLRTAALNAVQAMNGGKAKADLRDAYDATPNQCLREIQASAIDAAVDFEDGRYCETVGDRIDMILDYANLIRQEGDK